MIITPTPTPFISPDTIQKANENLWLGISFAFDEFKFAFAVLGVLLVLILGLVYVRNRRNRI